MHVYIIYFRLCLITFCNVLISSMIIQSYMHSLKFPRLSNTFGTDIKYYCVYCKSK